MISKMNEKDVTEDQSLRNAEYLIFHVHYLAAFHLRIPYVHHNVYDIWNVITQWKMRVLFVWMNVFITNNVEIYALYRKYLYAIYILLARVCFIPNIYRMTHSSIHDGFPYENDNDDYFYNSFRLIPVFLSFVTQNYTHPQHPRKTKTKTRAGV